MKNKNLLNFHNFQIRNISLLKIKNLLNNFTNLKYFCQLNNNATAAASAATTTNSSRSKRGASTSTDASSSSVQSIQPRTSDVDMETVRESANANGTTSTSGGSEEGREAGGEASASRDESFNAGESSSRSEAVNIEAEIKDVSEN